MNLPHAKASNNFPRLRWVSTGTNTISTIDKKMHFMKRAEEHEQARIDRLVSNREELKGA